MMQVWVDQIEGSNAPAGGSKSSLARPQRVNARIVPGGYVEGLNDARTKPASFFSLLLLWDKDEHPRRGLFDHIRESSGGTAGWHAWEDASPANLHGTETIGGFLSQKQRKDSRNLPS